MKKIPSWVLITVLCVSFITAYSLSGCKTEAVTEQAAEATAEASEEVAGGSMAEIAISEAKKLAEGKNIQLKMLVTWDAPGTALIEALPKWEEATGIKVIPEQLSTIEASRKINLELSGGGTEYDMFQYDMFIRKPILDNAGVLNMEPYIEKWNPHFETMVPTLEEVCSNGDGNITALPFYWCSYIMAYRKDLFENPDEQAAFKEKYGYDLDVANLTWDKSYKDAAEFFTRDTDGDGEIDFWGTAEMFAPYAAGDTFLSRYLNYWDADKRVFSDPETGKSTLRDEATKQTFNDLKDIVDNGWIVPDHIQIDWASILGSFGSGRAAMALQYAPTWTPIQAETSEFKISGPDIVGFTAVPGIDGHQRSTQCSGGWLTFINNLTDYPEICYLFNLWVMSDEIDKELAMTTLHCPIRKATYEDPEVLAVNSTFEAQLLYPDGLVPIPDNLIFEEEVYIVSQALQELSAGTITDGDQFVEYIASRQEEKWAEVLGQ